MLILGFSSFLFTLYFSLNTIIPLLLWLTFNCHLLRKFSVSCSILVSSCSLSAIPDMSSMNNNDAMVRYRYLVPKSFPNKWKFRSSMKHANLGPDNGLPFLKLPLTITSSVRPNFVCPIHKLHAIFFLFSLYSKVHKVLHLSKPGHMPSLGQ